MGIGAMCKVDLFFCTIQANNITQMKAGRHIERLIIRDESLKLFLINSLKLNCFKT